MDPHHFRASSLPFPPAVVSEKDLCNGLPSITPKQQCMSATLDSQLSICVDGSPTSILKPNDGNKLAKVAMSGSFGEQSDDDDDDDDNDDVETEAGTCEQSTDAIDMKLLRRKVSNRESARRSRKRRQAHLAELEWQVEKLKSENSSLCKELTEAAQQLRDATTNYRFLKSDVELLRAKVDLAEELVARGSLTSTLNNLLQSNSFSSPQLLSTPNLPPLEDMSPPSFLLHGDNDHILGGTFNPQNPSIITGNMDAFLGNQASPDVCTWDSISTVTN